MSSINRKIYGTSFYQEKEIQDCGWGGGGRGQGSDPVNHKSKTQKFNTKMATKENSHKQPLPRTIERIHVGVEIQRM